MRIRAHGFNLAKTLESGQFFRHKKTNGWHYLQSRNKVFKAKQKKNTLIVKGNVSRRFVKKFFGLNNDYAKIIKSISRDSFARKIVRRHKGIRIMQQDPWECLVSFICATASNIPKIRQNIENLARQFGRQVRFDKMTFYTFPAPGTLCNKNKIRKCGTGFRTNYIMHANKHATKKWLESLKKMPYDKAKQEIMQIQGVGEKVADCVLLYSLGKNEAFPVDVWIKRIMEKEYFGGKKTSEKEIRKFASANFGSHAGWLQQFLYVQARAEKKAKK